MAKTLRILAAFGMAVMVGVIACAGFFGLLWIGTKIPYEVGVAIGIPLYILVIIASFVFLGRLGVFFYHKLGKEKQDG